MFCHHHDDVIEENDFGETKIIGSEENKEIYIVGFIDEDALPLFDSMAESILKKSLKYKPKQAPLNIIVSSDGGMITTAFGIYDSIREINCTVSVHTIVKGVAASAALLIAQAGAQRFIYPHSIIQFHSAHLENGSRHSMSRSDVNDLKKDVLSLRAQKEELKILNKILFSVLHERSGIPYKNIERYSFASATYGAQEARTLGLFDNIIDVEIPTRNKKRR